MNLLRYLKPITLYFIFIFNTANGQIQIVDPPNSGYQKRITQAINQILIVDTHEHLTTEAQRIQNASNLDFTYLFRHYVKEDFISASNNKAIVDVIYNDSNSVSQRWQIMEPLYKAVRSTGYGRVPLIAARDLYGISEINAATIDQLSKKIRTASKPGLYEYILKERSKIDVSIQDMGHQKMDSSFFKHVERFDRFVLISSKSEILDLGRIQGINIKSLEDFEKALRKSFMAGVDYGMVGVKSALAYKRILNYKNESKEIADKIFKNVLANKQIQQTQIKKLQDYLMHRLLDLLNEFDLPIQIHTGLHAGNGNMITNSKPTHLTNLFFEYPEVKFILFHGGYPYGGELGTLAKNFPNVYIDMCWTYIISPSYSERYLHEWIETVPANKIMAFGGDYDFVEAVYAHSVMARQIIAKVIIDKVKDQYLSENEAIDLAKMILRENALRVFKIGSYTKTFDEVEVLNKPGPLHDWWQLNQSKQGIVKKWKVLGIFEHGIGLDQIYPPENKIELNGKYQGKGGNISWKTEESSNSGYLNFISIFSKQNSKINPKNKGLAYAYTEIISPDKRSIKLTLGSNDGAKLWVNNKVEYNKHVGRNAVLDHEIISVNLEKGLNTILVKVENLGAGWGLYLRVIDPNRELQIKEFDSH